MLVTRLHASMLLAFAAAGLFAGCSSSSSSGWSSSSGSGGSYGDAGAYGSDAGRASTCTPETLPAQTRFATKDLAVADARAADVDGDGHVDLVVADASGYRVYTNDELGVLAPLERVDLGRMQLAHVVLGDFDADGHVDLVLSGDRWVGLGLGVGDGSFKEVVWTRTATTPGFTAVATLDDDGQDDLVVRLDTKLVAYKNVAGTLTEMHSTYVGAGALALGDFDEDKHVDAAVLDTVGHMVLYSGDGNGTFLRKSSANLSTLASEVFTHDIDGDGHLDLVTAETGQLVTLLGHGDLTFGEELYSQTTSIGHAVVFGDVDGDGHDDVAGATTAGTLVVLLGNGVGTLEAPRTYAVGSYAYELTALTAADFDEDGKSDVVIVDEGAIAIAAHGCR
ncbi:MAG: hypothetical protein JWM74_2975 [Myxococcaceae bacterium]|nr:hypothetical protein [Myxococcaceae bacterium]